MSLQTTSPELEASVTPPRKTAKRPSPTVVLARKGLGRLSVNVALSLVQRARRAADEEGVTLAEVVARAVSTELAKLEESRGAPFPSGPMRLRPGPRPQRWEDEDEETG